MLMHQARLEGTNQVEIAYHYAGTQLFSNGLVALVIRLSTSGNSR